MARGICEPIGDVHKSTGAINEDGGNFIWVRVTLDVSLPLCRGRGITLENVDKAWVFFKYERQPNLCYWWGRLNHDEKNCKLWIDRLSSNNLAPICMHRHITLQVKMLYLFQGIMRELLFCYWWCRKSHQWEARSLCSNKSPTQKKKTKSHCRRHRCGVGQIPSEGQVRNILITLEC